MAENIWSLLGMLLVVILILGAAYVVTRMIARQGALSFGGVAAKGVEELYVLRQIPIGRGERLVLVRLHERCLLLGTAQGSVSLLAELSAAEAEPWLNEPAGGDFLKLLHTSAKK